jgi:hypothetical protein
VGLEDLQLFPSSPSVTTLVLRISIPLSISSYSKMSQVEQYILKYLKIYKLNKTLIIIEIESILP